MGDARDRSLARRAEDVDVVAVRGERGDQPGRRALDAAVEDEGAGDDQEAHCSGGRGAGAIGGWPETRSDPAAFRMPQLIPRKGGRGAGAIGGWPETRSDPAAFRMPQLIPRKGDRGAGAFGGWPDTRCDPAAFRMPPFTPPRGASRPSACRESVDQWEQHGPGGAEAVSLVAAPAGPGPELARLVRALEQAPDRRREPARVPRRHDEPAAVEDLGDHRHRRGNDRTPERHRVEELRGHLAHRVRRLALGHRHDVCGDEETRDVVEWDLAEHPHVRERRPAPYRRTSAVRTDQREDDIRPEEPHRLDEIVDALVGPRRAEKHNDLFPRDP